MRIAYRLYRGWWRAVDALYPPVCGGCGTPGERWCSSCNRQTHRILPPWCPQCGEPLVHGTCPRCTRRPLQNVVLRSWAVFDGPLRQALHRIKYRRDLGLADCIAAEMLAFFQTELRWNIDMVIPVPLSAKRLRERGYNQAAQFALPLALALGARYRPSGVRRIRHTVSQVKLSWQERQDNVTGAFYANPRLVAGQKILLIDDVVTTGATISACATALLDAGARNVYALSVARAMQHYHTASEVAV